MTPAYKRMPGIRIISIGLVWILVCFSGPALSREGGDPENQILIIIHSTAEVKGDKIFLGDIAQIYAPPFFREGLAGIEISRSPKPGRITHLRGAKIISLIRTRGLEDKEMDIRVPKQVFVKRKSQELKETRVLRELTAFLSLFFDKENFKVKAFRVRGIEPYPDGELTLTFDERYKPGGRGRLSVHADVMVDGVPRDRVNIKGRIALYESVICAAKPLKKGAEIIRTDIRLKTVNVYEFKGKFLETFEDVAGLTLTQDFDKDECLTRASFKQTPVIKKGDVVKLVARKKRLSIVTFGVCSEDGFRDQPVWVENLKSGKLVRGLVKKDATVEVMF